MNVRRLTSIMSAKHRAMTKTEAETYVAQALSLEQQASKTALSKIQSQGYAYGERLSAVILSHLPPPREIQNDARRLEILYKLIYHTVFSKAAEQNEQAIANFAWQGLESSNGMVRQAARRLLDSARTISHNTSLEDSAAAYVALLDRIEDKLRQHLPKNPPSSVEKAPPSVYKTMTLLWYDVAYIPIVHSTTDVEQRMIDNDIMPYDEPSDDTDDYPEEFDLQEWKMYIESYATCEDAPRLQRLLKKREQYALDMLDWALADLGLQNERDKIIYHAQFGEQDALASILQTRIAPVILSATSEQEGMLYAFQCNKFARAIQYLANNYVHKSHDNTPFSLEVTEAILCEQEKISAHKVDLGTFVTAFSAAHDAIDMLAKHIIATYEKEARDFERLEKIHNLHTAIPLPATIDITEATQVVHYMLDKIPSSDYKHLIRQQPERVAAGLWKLFVDENPWLLLATTNAELTAFGKWAGASGLSGTAYTYRYLIEQTLADPTIVVVIRNANDLEAAKSIL